MINEELKELRRQMFDDMERKLQEDMSPEERMFYFHKSEDRIVLSHALLFEMLKSIKGRIAKEKFFLLLRQYQEEMLSAYLTEDAYFPELLRYCNIICEYLPVIIRSQYDLGSDKEARKFSAMVIVACGYGGDMPNDLADELLDDMNFHYNKVESKKIRQLLPRLSKLVEEEMKL